MKILVRNHTSKGFIYVIIFAEAWTSYKEGYQATSVW